MLNKKFLKYFGTEKNASKYFLPEIWKQVKPLFSYFCGMGKKLVGLKDADGNKIEIKGFPFTFNGTTYATKESFEQAMSTAYGVGYSVNLIDCCHLMVIWTRGLEEVPDYIEETPIANYSAPLLNPNYPVTDIVIEDENNTVVCAISGLMVFAFDDTVIAVAINGNGCIPENISVGTGYSYTGATKYIFKIYTGGTLQGTITFN